MNRTSWLSLSAVAVLALAATPARGQAPPLKLPDASPEASVTQRVGLTDLSVTYHRPAVNKRKVWGELVPYGEVWRAGANENTLVTFSSPVTVGGKELGAGSYGLHMIPTEKAWTVILSTQTTDWGSFAYDAKDDAHRFSVSPEPAEHVERLAYTFDDPTDRSVTLSLRWEKLRLPVKIEVDSKAVIAKHIRGQLRGLPQFFWQGWNQAAAWCAQNDTNLDEAMAWAEKSIGLNQNFTNMRTKALLLEKKGDAKGAADLRAQAMARATEPEVNAYGYQLLGQGKLDEAIEAFKKNVKDHPESWNTYDSLAEGYARKGDKAQATALYKKAYEMTKDEAQRKRITTELAKLK